MDIIIIALLIGAVGFAVWKLAFQKDDESVDTPPVAPAPQVPPTEKDLSKLKKEEIELVGRDWGIELDRRMTKANMIKDLQKQIKADKR